MLSSEMVDGTGRISASGELDLATVPELEAAYAQALAASPSTLLVDLHAVTFMDSTGMALLLDMLERRGAVELRFAISPPIERLLELVGLAGRLPLAQDGTPSR